MVSVATSGKEVATLYGGGASSKSVGSLGLVGSLGFERSLGFEESSATHHKDNNNSYVTHSYSGRLHIQEVSWTTLLLTSQCN